MASAYFVPLLKQKLDNGFTNNPYKTKQTSMQKYKILYSGQDYFIHFKYSNSINVIYITMMYGLAIPLLFPVAAFNFWAQFIAERVTVAFLVK